jgi:hypothetical protein
MFRIDKNLTLEKPNLLMRISMRSLFVLIFANVLRPHQEHLQRTQYHRRFYASKMIQDYFEPPLVDQLSSSLKFMLMPELISSSNGRARLRASMCR